jgi:hypothetical protein
MRPFTFALAQTPADAILAGKIGSPDQPDAMQFLAVERRSST